MTYEQWEAGVPVAISADSLWRVKAYRLGLFLSDLAWADAVKLNRHRLALGISDQLVRAAGNGELERIGHDFMNMRLDQSAKLVTGITKPEGC